MSASIVLTDKELVVFGELRKRGLSESRLIPLFETRRLEQALKKISAGPKAKHVNFTKSKEMAGWICWACDRATEALSTLPTTRKGRK